MLEFQPDHEEACRRIESWWQCEIIDRLPIMITAPRDPRECAPVPQSGSVAEQWWREEFVLDRAVTVISNTLYKGEALPVFSPDLGRDVFASFVGADLVFGTDDVFVESPYESLAGLPEFSLDLGNPYLRWLEKCMREAIGRARGKFLVGLPLLHGGLDCLAALVTPARLAAAAEKEPDRIESLVNALDRLWNEVYVRFARPLLDEYGATHAAPCMHAGRCGLFIPRAAGALKPGAGAGLIQKDLQPKTARLDRSLVRLENPAGRDLKILLGLQDLSGLWLDLRGCRELPREGLHAVQAAGKCLLLDIEAAQLEAITDMLGTRGVMPRIQAEDEAEADALLAFAGKIVS